MTRLKKVLAALIAVVFAALGLNLGVCAGRFHQTETKPERTLPQLLS